MRGGPEPSRTRPSAAERARRRLRVWADQGLAALLLGGCVVVPSIFSLSSDDVFALPKGIALAVITGTATLPAAALAATGWGRSRRQDVAVHLLLLAFVVLNAMACVQSLDPVWSLKGAPRQYQGFLAILLYAWALYLAEWTLRTPRRLILLFRAVTLGAAPVAVYALIQWAGLDPLWGFPDRPFPGRALSTFGQPNALAAYLVLAICAATGLWLRRATSSETRRALLALTIGLLLAAHVATFSRGGAAGLLTAVGILASFRLRHGWRTPARLAAGLAGVVLITIALAWQVAPVRTAMAPLGAGLRRLGTGASLRQHVALWIIAVRVARDFPLLGTGQETFAETFADYRDFGLLPEQTKVLEGTIPESPHSVYLAVAAGAGIPALVAYLGLVAVVTVRLGSAIRAVGRDSGRGVLLLTLMAALVGHLVTDAFMTAELMGSWLFWVLMGAALGSARGVILSRPISARRDRGTEGPDPA